MELEPGYFVSKHVRLLRELKRGGMGSVWVADHLALQTQVAVKFMAAMIADDIAAIARFAREATSAAQIKSPHVVQVHDYGVTSDGTPFMVMELLHGEDLSTRIKREGPLPFEAAAQVVLQVCRVLGKAHPLGIVHRDIKPSNLFLIDADGEVFVKVLDFGVAKMGDDGESELTTTGVMVGTLVYMSPEQLLSAKTVDHRADLWSLAVSAYQAMTGELPFKRDDGLGALCRAMEEGAFALPSACVADVPPAVDAWFKRAFAPRAEARFGSAKEMFDTLHHAMGRSSVPMSAPSRGLVARTPKASFPSMPTFSAAEATISDSAANGPPSSEAEPGASPPSSQPDELKGPSVAPAQTLAGTASLPLRPKRRSGLPLARALGVAALVLSGLGAGALLGRSGRLSPVGRWRSSEGTAAPHPELAPEPSNPASVAAPAVAPVPMVGDPPNPPARPVAMSAPIPKPEGSTDGPLVLPAASSASSGPARAASSAAPPLAASAKARGPRGGARSGQPEKDYGF